MPDIELVEHNRFNKQENRFNNQEKYNNEKNNSTIHVAVYFK